MLDSASTYFKGVGLCVVFFVTCAYSMDQMWLKKDAYVHFGHERRLDYSSYLHRNVQKYDLLLEKLAMSEIRRQHLVNELYDAITRHQQLLVLQSIAPDPMRIPDEKNAHARVELAEKQLVAANQKQEALRHKLWGMGMRAVETSWYGAYEQKLQPQTSMKFCVRDVALSSPKEGMSKVEKHGDVLLKQLLKRNNGFTLTAGIGVLLMADAQGTISVYFAVGAEKVTKRKGKKVVNSYWLQFHPGGLRIESTAAHKIALSERVWVGHKETIAYHRDAQEAYKHTARNEVTLTVGIADGLHAYVGYAVHYLGLYRKRISGGFMVGCDLGY